MSPALGTPAALALGPLCPPWSIPDARAGELGQALP